MKIDKLEYQGKEFELKKLEQKLINFNEIKDTKPSLNFPDLISKNVDWNEIKYTFKENFREYDDLLFKIHFKRKKPLAKKERDNVLKFLAIGYLSSHDVRYFNEFIFFYSGNDYSKKLWPLMVKSFFNNLNKSNYHSFPLNKKNNVEKFIKKTHEKIKKIKQDEDYQSNKIALLGSPTFFKKIRYSLIAKGYDVKCYFLPYHPRKIVNILFNNKISFKIFLMIKKINFPFQTINYDYKDAKITQLLKKENLDIGFHKLGFIIKKNIIESFKIGLINDHWAILPFIKGRSTIEYSLLFGFPIGATTHIISEKVDHGDIINIYTYHEAYNLKKIKTIKDYIRKLTFQRAINSIEILSTNKKAIIKNSSQKGLMYYSVNPLLVNFIEKNILK